MNSVIKYFRADQQTEEMIQLLLAQLKEEATPGMRVTTSDAIRAAIHAGVDRLMNRNS